MRWYTQVCAYRFRRSTALLLFFLAILGGIGLAHAVYIPLTYILPLLLPIIVQAFRHKSWLGLLLLVLCGLVLGLWRGGDYVQRLSIYDELYYQPITVFVQAKEDAVYGKTKQLSFVAGNVTMLNGTHLTGKLQISGFGENAVFQNDVVRVSGKLYPSRGAYQGRISFGVMDVTERHPTLISNFRRQFVAGAQSALPDPIGPFVMGLLVGQRATLPEDLKQDFRHVGLTHIVAVSGYNLTIILQASRKLLGNRSKRIATFLSVALICVFLLIAGSSASIVRAAIVSMLSITAAYYGRGFKPLNLLAFAAAITAWANPIYIWSDLSWYLSFLAFYGVMILGPLIQSRWPGKLHSSVIFGVALESLSAELLTLPFILYIFGEMSHIGIVANVLVVTLIPLAMLLGVIAGFAGMFAVSIAGWFCWPAVILLTYMLDTAHILANLPNVFVSGIGLSLHGMLAMYAVLAFLTAVLTHKTKGIKRATITDLQNPKYRGIMA